MFVITLQVSAYRFLYSNAAYSEPLLLRTIFSGPTFFDKNAGIEHSL